MTEINFKEYRADEMREKFQFPPLNILLVGVTGAGKSSTINALLGNEAAKVGAGADPETKDICGYKINDYLCFYDTPGLGDSPTEDVEHLKKITSYLDKSYRKKGVRGKVIDKVLVVMDGSSRDFGKITEVLNNYIFNTIESENVWFAVNQADMAMKGHHWNTESGTPDEKLEEFLQEKALSVKERIEESSGKTVNMPVCYSAEHGFNITQLIDFIVDNADSQRKEPCDDDESYSSSSDSTDLVDDILDFTGDVIATAIAVPATIIATPFIIAKSIWDSIFD